MGGYLLKVLDWSEVWALMIPLALFLFRRRQPASLRPVLYYLLLAFAINLAIDIIMLINMQREDSYLSNNPLYNLHSVVRFACFSAYFIQLPQGSFSRIRKALLLVFVVFLLVNFIFFEDFFNYNAFSGNLLATEAYLLLVYCMLYYLAALNDDNKNLFKGPDFWVVTGLCVYVVVNFFVFLFYLPMIYVDRELAINIWNVHNIAFIIFCLFITKALYGTARHKFAV